MNPQNPRLVAFAQFSRDSGELRRGSWGVQSVAVNTASQDWTINLSEAFNGISPNSDDMLAETRILSSGIGADARFPVQLAHSGNGVRIASVNPIGDLADVAGDVIVKVYRRIGE